MKGLIDARNLLAAVLAAASNAWAMNEVPASPYWCQVEGSEKLPSQSGGVTALCEAIRRALPSGEAIDRLAVRVQVGERSRLRAEVTLAGGRTLPPLSMTQTDRPISRATLERFGAAIAEQIARTRR